MSKRHAEALAIQQGACNPSGIARSLVIACDEARAEGSPATTDAAVRLIVHQLYSICGGWEIDNGGGTYGTLLAECRRCSLGTTDAQQKP